MTDKELLNLAAKAAGIAIMPCTCSDERWPFKHNESVSGKRGHWNPLHSDGDALRLAVKLGISIEFEEDGGGVVAAGCGGFSALPAEGDLHAATRRAIVRAAAEIGKSPQGKI